jgi:hypothetical protein
MEHLSGGTSGMYIGATYCDIYRDRIRVSQANPGIQYHS